ncbi:MAG: hypothetical protein ACM31C_16335 [Acidobacteriota bacterium]
MIARLLAIAIVLVAVPARAQSVEAESLFREGRKLLQDGKIREACEKLDASERLEPSVGTELNLADCRELNDQLATAWATFRKAAANAKREGNDSKREAEARRRASALEPRLSYLTIVVPDDARVDGLSITRNGAIVETELWNEKVAIDAGDYEIAASAPGRAPWHAKLAIRDEGEKAKVEVPALDKKQIEHEHAHEHDQAETTKQAEPDEEQRGPAAPSSFTSRRKVAVALVVAGVAAAGVGGYLASQAHDLEHQSDQLCPMVSCTDAKAVALNQDARDHALYANIGFVAGGAVVAGAIVLWLVGAPHPVRDDVSIAPSLAPGRAGLAITGSF